MAKNRKQWHVVWSKALRRWVVKRKHEPLALGAPFRRKVDAVQYAVRAARAEQPSQLLIHDKRDVIREERTYGQDPRRTPGRRRR